MTETLTPTSIFNSFAVWRELLQSIDAFTSLLTSGGVELFSQDDRYFQDEPNPKAGSFIQYPLVLIDTIFTDRPLTYLEVKQIDYTTVITIRSDYHIEQTTPRINSYINAIVNYLNSNQTTLLRTYGLNGIKVSVNRDKDVIQEKQLVVGIITVDYNVIMDVE